MKQNQISFNMSHDIRTPLNGIIVCRRSHQKKMLQARQKKQKIFSFKCEDPSCEDNELNMDIAFELLKSRSKVVQTKWAEALTLFQETSRFLCVILMDVMMPVMDGLEAGQAIRSPERKDAQTILLSLLQPMHF
ncbi:MAG: hypothetical protein ACLUV8_13295 [Clostridium sp.]